MKATGSHPISANSPLTHWPQQHATGMTVALTHYLYLPGGNRASCATVVDQPAAAEASTIHLHVASWKRDGS